MRIHRRYPWLAARIDRDLVLAIADPSTLVAARLEAIATPCAEFALDLWFADGRDEAVVTGILIEGDTLVERERDPLVWPQRLAALGDDRAAAIGARVLPWIRALVLAEPMNGEATRIYGDEPFARAFAHARERGELGAAPYAAALGGAVPLDHPRAVLRRARPLAAPLPPVVAGGGASGRVLFVVPDGDDGEALREEARALAALLRATGMHVDLGDHRTHEVGAYDLVHAFGLLEPAHTAEALAVARAAHVPTALTPALIDVTNGGFWGAFTHAFAYEQFADMQGEDDLLARVAARALQTTVIPPAGRSAPSEVYFARQVESLALADAVFAGSGAETAVLREVYRTAAPLYAYVPALPPFVRGDGPPIVLVHAPLARGSNLAPIARACAMHELPVAFAGPLADPTYAHLVREYLADDGSVMLPEPTPDELADLYGRARVYVDLAWLQPSTSRAARALAGGAALVAGTNGYLPAVFGAGVVSADPAAADAIAGAIRGAWDAAQRGDAELRACAERARAMTEPSVALQCVFRAYTALAQPAGV